MALMSEDFLDLIWGDQHGWIDMPAKIDQYWAPWHYEYEGETDNIMSGRIDSCLNDRESLYFSPGIFEQRGRHFDDLRPPQWLWADLDEIDPDFIQPNLLPTVAWESSDDRFQAMWKLIHPIKPTSFDHLNQSLSYYLGADHGGWDRTQVLRLPSTRNFKYSPAPMVTLLWFEEEREYDPRDIWKIVKGSVPLGVGLDAPPLGLRPGTVPARVRELLRATPDTVVHGERSATLWKIECMLAESGWGADAIYDVVARSAWNKWAAVGTGERRLRQEISKAIRHVQVKAISENERERKEKTTADIVSERGVVDRPSDGSADLDGSGGDTGKEKDGDVVSMEPDVLVFPWREYDKFMALAMAEPKWLIQGIWTAGSQGILGGEPKTSKTTLGLALGMSVASGKPLFGDPNYPVKAQGPVLFVQEENAPWMVQDRMRKLAHLYGIGGSVVDKTSSGGGDRFDLTLPDDIPMRLLNNYGFDLTLGDHQEGLWKEVERFKPRLVVLDPLYMIMAGINFNQAHELAPYLKWLLALSNEFNCAVCIIHHFRKAQPGNNTRPGQRLMGNATLHGFVDSALYCEQMDPDDPRKTGTLYTRVHREFRSIEPQRALEFGIRM